MTDDSMVPRLNEGDIVFVSKVSYGLRVPGAGALLLEWKQPQKGELVLVASMSDPPATVLRRIANVPGEQIQLPGKDPQILKADEYFLLAETQAEALDSRLFGPLARRFIVGKATHVWPSKTSSASGGSGVESSKSIWRLPQRIL